MIVKCLGLPSNYEFFDVCCGSGAVSIEAVERGQDPKSITMIDQGPWGLFWKAIGDGSFDLEIFRRHINNIPKNPKQVKEHVESVYRQPLFLQDVPYLFLILQASAVGGAAIYFKDGKWVRTSGFRDYWLPTETSSRRSPVNPMMPMPDTIFERVSEIVVKMKGVKGICADASNLQIQKPSVVYIDPQYEGTTGYGYELDVVKLANRLSENGSLVFVSEGKALSQSAICLSEGRSKGGITGDRKKEANQEWLSCFRKL